jgi:nitroreductase
MDAITNLLTRNSPRELTNPIPSQDEMHQIYKAALRAPDHAWLRPSRFIEVTGKGLEKLSKVFVEFATNEFEDVTPLQMEKYESAPYRAPMIIILATKLTEHPKVPKTEQMLSTAAAAENILLALHAKGYAGIWRTGKFAFNKKMAKYLNITSDHEVIGYLYVGTPSSKNKKIPKLDIAEFVTHWNA